MQEFKITMAVDGEEQTSNWSGYGEQSAIAQAMLYYAQNGARNLKVIEIKQ